MFRVIKRKDPLIHRYSGTVKNSSHGIEWLLFFCFLFGLLLGSFSVRTMSDDLQIRVLDLLRSYFKYQSVETKISHFVNNCIKQTILLLILYLSGLCALGTPFVLFQPICIGIVTGLFSAVLYSNFFLKGIGYCALLVYPFVMFWSAISIAAEKNALHMTTKILQSISGEYSAEPNDLREYNIRFIAFLILCTVNSLLDTVLFSLFMRYFQFF